MSLKYAIYFLRSTKMSIFQELDIDVDRADYRPAVLSILAAIRPQWKKEEIYIPVRALKFYSFAINNSVEDVQTL